MEVARWSIPVSFLVLALFAGRTIDGNSLWGLLPIACYAIVALSGVNLLVATFVAFLTGILLTGRGVAETGEILGDSLGDMVAIIGIVILLGGALGELLRVSGIADELVRGVMRLVRNESMFAVQVGVMLSCVVLTFILGTLAGGLAIAAPVLLPLAARAGYTRSATAVMMFLGGCGGIAIAPFAGSNIAILAASGIGYGEYLLVAAGPLLLLSLLLGMLIVPRVQRRAVARDDPSEFYPAESGNGEAQVSSARIRRSALIFGAALIGVVVFGAMQGSSTTYPLVALPVLAGIVVVSGGIRVKDAAAAVSRGAARLLELFVMFWLLAAFFLMVTELGPFDVILDRFGGEITGLPLLPFAFGVTLLGWVGVPGANAAQVVLLDGIFGPIGTAIGMTPAAWAVTYLLASKADTYGPFPNPNMVVSLGFAESDRIKTLLGVGWLVLIPAGIMFSLILYMQLG